MQVAADGSVVGDPESNLQLVAETHDAGAVDTRILDCLFSSHFDLMRERASAEARRWLENRAQGLRLRRSEQAEVLIRDLEVDLADRLREIGDEERRSRGLIEETGQRRLFAEDEGRGGFEARRALVHSSAAQRRSDIADFCKVGAPGAPRPLGALFPVPEGYRP